MIVIDVNAFVKKKLFSLIKINLFILKLTIIIIIIINIITIIVDFDAIFFFFIHFLELGQTTIAIIIKIIQLIIIKYYFFFYTPKSIIKTNYSRWGGEGRGGETVIRVIRMIEIKNNIIIIRYKGVYKQRVIIN